MPCPLECIDHVEVFVRDLEVSARWYVDVLGLEECARWDPHPIMVGKGGSMLALFRLTQPSDPPPAESLPITVGWRRVAWRTDKAGFDAAQKHLKDKGVAFRGPVDHEQAWSIYFCDPDGNPLEITYYL